MDGAEQPVIRPSLGSHIVLSPQFCAPDTGMLLPKTADGRVMFILPWNGATLIGTTDRATSQISDNPIPTPGCYSWLDIFVLTACRRYNIYAI